jgi:serralysin
MNTNWFCKNIEHRHGQTAIGQRGAYWKPGSILRVKFINGTQAEHQYVQDVCKDYEKICNIKFLIVTSGESDIRITFNESDGAWSYVGTQNREISQSENTMNLGWLEATVHEFGHALGLLHEHQSPKSRIKWNKPVVIGDLSRPPNSWDLQTIQEQVFDQYSPADIDSTVNWDSKSAMEYPIPASWDELGVGAPGSETLSNEDKEFLLKQYPFDVVTVPVNNWESFAKQVFINITELTYLKKSSLVRLGVGLGLLTSDKKTFKVNLELVRQKLKL